MSAARGHDAIMATQRERAMAGVQQRLYQKTHEECKGLKL